MSDIPADTGIAEEDNGTAGEADPANYQPRNPTTEQATPDSPETTVRDRGENRNPD